MIGWIGISWRAHLDVWVPVGWITGISALFRYASSAITIGGHVGRQFPLSRSVRQGCPLAAYLYLLVGEVLSDFLRGQSSALRAVNLLDQEFVDDTLLFL